MSMYFKLTILVSLSYLSSAVLAEDIVRGERGRKVDRHLTKRAEKGFSGVVFAAKAGEIIISKGYGFANQAEQIPFTSSTVFTVGSLTKQFTGAAILKLEMQNKLRVGDQIGKYFDNVPADKRSMTLHHLLTHSAGLKEGFGRDFEAVNRDQIIELCMESELLWPPGTRYQYSNAGYSLLAAIIELVTGDSYERFVHDELFRPAGMLQTGYRIPEWDPAQMAHGYLESGKDWGTLLDYPWDEDGPYWNLRGNGGLMSTADDLFRWHQALNGTSLLSDEAKAKYFAPHVKQGSLGSKHYGYGWVVAERKDGTKVISHDGSNGIFLADMIRYVDEDLMLLMASNQEAHRAEKLFVLNMLR